MQHQEGEEVISLKDATMKYLDKGEKVYIRFVQNYLECQGQEAPDYKYGSLYEVQFKKLSF